MKTGRRIICCLILPLLFFGCATGRREASSLEVLLRGDEGDVLLAERLNLQILQSYPVAAPSEGTERVRRVARRLRSVCSGDADRLRFTVLESDEANAFALGTGYVYVTTAMLDFVGSEDELAAVVAHEIGHVTHGDLPRQNRGRAAYDLATQGLGIGSMFLGTAGTVVGYGLYGLDLAVGLLFRSAGRGDEHAADAFSARCLQRAGYDPAACAVFLERLRAAESRAGKGDSALGRFLSTHPPTPKRVKRVRRLVEDLRGED